MTTSDKPDNASETPAEPTGVAAQDWTKASADPQYRAAVVDLLGALAYGELAAFERLAEDAKLRRRWRTRRSWRRWRRLSSTTTRSSATG